MDAPVAALVSFASGLGCLIVGDEAVSDARESVKRKRSMDYLFAAAFIIAVLLMLGLAVGGRDRSEN